MAGVAVKVGLKASRKPYIANRLLPYAERIARRAGIAISGAKDTEPPAAVGAMVPSSWISVKEAPRARPSRVTVTSAGPSEAVSPQRVTP